jgi:hypothetical protein
LGEFTGETRIVWWVLLVTRKARGIGSPHTHPITTSRLSSRSAILLTMPPLPTFTMLTALAIPDEVAD